MRAPRRQCAKRRPPVIVQHGRPPHSRTTDPDSIHQSRRKENGRPRSLHRRRPQHMNRRTRRIVPDGPTNWRAQTKTAAPLGKKRDGRRTGIHPPDIVTNGRAQARRPARLPPAGEYVVVFFVEYRHPPFVTRAGNPRGMEDAQPIGKTGVPFEMGNRFGTAPRIETIAHHKIAPQLATAHRWHTSPLSLAQSSQRNRPRLSHDPPALSAQSQQYHSQQPAHGTPGDSGPGAPQETHTGITHPLCFEKRRAPGGRDPPPGTSSRTTTDRKRPPLPHLPLSRLDTFCQSNAPPSAQARAPGSIVAHHRAHSGNSAYSVSIRCSCLSAPAVSLARRQ